MFAPRPIADVATELGLGPDDYEPYGRGKAKIDRCRSLDRPARGKGRLILVTAINPTPAGEGKTTTSIGLAMGMRRLGKNARSRAARAVARPGVRREGRRHRRRQGVARARRRHQPPLHRRHPRDHHRAQPALRDGRQRVLLRRRHPGTRARSIRARSRGGARST